MAKIEQSLLDALFSYSRRPTLEEAKHCFEVREVQDAAISVAKEIRDEAIEISWRRCTVEKIQPLNHRWFLVGGVGVGIVPVPHERGLNDWFVAFAWNTMPQFGDTKECSERRIGKRALKARCRCLVGVAIVGERNEDKRSGITYRTLEPCEMCRDDMRGQFRPLYRRETHVLMELPTRQVRVLKTLPQLMHGHNETWP